MPESEKNNDASQRLEGLQTENDTLREALSHQTELLGTYLEKINALQAKVDLLSSVQSGTVHNERGAGRKKDDKKITAERVDFLNLQDEGCSMIEIMDKMQISRSTYYRLKRYAEMAQGKAAGNTHCDVKE